MAPITQFAYRTGRDIGLVDAAPTYDAVSGFVKPQGRLRCCVYSPDGRYFAWATPENVIVVNADTGSIVSTLPAENVFELGFSPLGTFVITWQRPSKDETTGDAVKNLKVWRVEEDVAEPAQKQTVGRFVQKSQTGWNLQYTFDERFCARVVTNEVQFYESHDLTKVWNKLRVEGVTDFAASPGDSRNIAVFVPERKGQPATVRVYNVPNFTTPISQKNFYKGDKVQFKWNDNGTSLIVLAQTEVDKTGKSYYGETTMYLLSAKGGFDSRIDLDKEGPVHDVTWSPRSNSFAVVYGYMPAKTVIFNSRAQAVHTFPLGPRNTVMYSPQGRFLLVAGFGNLAGQMDIYDLEKDFAKVCTIEAANPSLCEWSPDGVHLLTATIYDRLKVDNGIRVWHAGGQLMFNEDIPELYHVTWRPQPPSSHPLPENPFSPMPTPHPSAGTYLATKKTPSKPVGAYRPPGARGQVTPLAFRREDEGGAAFVRDHALSSGHGGTNGFGKSRTKAVPGAETADQKSAPPGAAPGGGVSLVATGDGADGEPLSKAAKKNAKKREARKAAAAAAATGKESSVGTLAPEPAGGRTKSPSQGPADGQGHQRSYSKDVQGNAGSTGSGLEPPTGPRNGRSRSESRKQGNPQPNGIPQRPAPSTPSQRKAAEPLDVVTASTADDTPAVEVNSPDTPGGNPHDKKIRGLLKKIRAIDDLKMRHAHGEKLEDTQVKKISSEDDVRKELQALGWNN